MKHLQAPFTVLRDTKSFFDQVKSGEGIREKTFSLLVASFFLFAFYGAIMGSFTSWMQAISSAVKLPILFVLTVLICLPTLYVAALLFGARESIGQYLAVLASTLAVTAALLVSFAPVTAFFMMTSSHYEFFKLLNVAVFSVAGIVGVRFFANGMRTIWGEAAATRGKILLPWIILYAFVGSQLGWTLRPFMGAPGMKFEVVRQIHSNFYIEVLKSLRGVLRIDEPNQPQYNPD